MQAYDDVVAAIGNTPLIKLRRASEETGCTILGKAEFINPGQSVKDRAGRQMILEAEKRGELRPGGLVVESTAGNTGIGLAIVANARGYRTLIVIPETQSREKKEMLRLCGAELVEVPAVPYSNPNFYQHVGRRLAEKLRESERNGVIFADQWNNPDNRKAHYKSTGPEIWRQTGGRIDGFICAIGTGGTFAGTSTYLREQKKDIAIGVADPHGAAMYSFFTQRRGQGIGRRLDNGRPPRRVRLGDVLRRHRLGDDDPLHPRLTNGATASHAVLLMRAAAAAWRRGWRMAPVADARCGGTCSIRLRGSCSPVRHAVRRVDRCTTTASRDPGDRPRLQARVRTALDLCRRQQPRHLRGDTWRRGSSGCRGFVRSTISTQDCGCW